jgi:cytochrome b
MSQLLRVRIWDLPTRLFHLVLALAVVGAVVSAKIGGAAMAWHFRFGYVVFGLLVFRLAWGLLGGRWSRFASFLYSPAVTVRYLLGRSRPEERLDVGHSPLGALSVFALLAVLAVQVGTGLVGDDEIAHVGPLNRFVASATALAATAWHKGFGQWIILSLVALHLAALALYAWRGRNLVAPMVHGDKILPAGTPASDDALAIRLRALVLALASAAAVWAVVRLGG